jgi:glycolate oxidase iron-sulfur subunit
LPDPALIKTCIHCGFCLPTCPTYLVWGEEMDSPRGRIVLMREAAESTGAELGSIATHIDRCLGCMACVTACPSGVRYDMLIEQMRPEVEERHHRSRADRAFRRFCFEVFTHPGRLRAAVPFLVAGRRLGLDRRLRSRLERRAAPAGQPAGGGLTVRRVAAMMRVAPDVKLSAAWGRLPEQTPANAKAGPSRGTVGLLQGCVARVFFARTNEATVRVLSAEGFDVVVPKAAGCCGALLMHSGAEDEAKERARATIAAFDTVGTVAVNAAGCGSAMKEYGRLLADDPEWAERAEAFVGKVKDVTEVLAGDEPRAPRHSVPM